MVDTQTHKTTTARIVRASIRGEGCFLRAHFAILFYQEAPNSLDFLSVVEVEVVVVVFVCVAMCRPCVSGRACIWPCYV